MESSASRNYSRHAFVSELNTDPRCFNLRSDSSLVSVACAVSVAIRKFRDVVKNSQVSSGCIRRNSQWFSNSLCVPQVHMYTWNTDIILIEIVRIRFQTKTFKFHMKMIDLWTQPDDYDESFNIHKLTSIFTYNASTYEFCRISRILFYLRFIKSKSNSWNPIHGKSPVTN